MYVYIYVCMHACVYEICMYVCKYLLTYAHLLKASQEKFFSRNLRSVNLPESFSWDRAHYELSTRIALFDLSMHVFMYVCMLLVWENTSLVCTYVCTYVQT